MPNVTWSHQLDFVPNFIFRLLGGRDSLYQELVILNMQVLQLHLLLLDGPQNRLILLLQFLKPCLRICVLSIVRSTSKHFVKYPPIASSVLSW